MRVAIQQSAVPHYAVALFERIGAEADIELVVSADADGPTALASHAPRGVEMRAARVRPLASLGLRGLHWADAQWAFAAPGACEVLVLEWNARYLSLVPAILRARRHGIPTLLWGHGYSKRPSRLRDVLRGLPARFADGLLLYEASTASGYAARAWRPRVVTHATNALDDATIGAAATAWRADPARLAAFRREHDLTPGRTLLFIGRLYPDNDLDFLLEAFHQVLDAHADARLIVIGEDVRERARLEGRARSLGVAHALRWTGALYEEHAIAPWALSSALFTYPRNVGLSLVHAFNYALPAVVAGPRHSHNPEIHALEDDVNGRLVDEPGTAAYAHAITELLRDDARRARLAAAARATVDSSCNLATMSAGFVAAIRAVAAAR